MKKKLTKQEHIATIFAEIINKKVMKLKDCIIFLRETGLDTESIRFILRFLIKNGFIVLKDGYILNTLKNQVRSKASTNITFSEEKDLELSEVGGRELKDQEVVELLNSIEKPKF